MEKQEIEMLNRAYRDNLSKTLMTMPTDVGTIVAMAATVVDLLREDIRNLADRMKTLTEHPNGIPPPPDGNGDPDVLATEVCKRLGALGLENLTELKFYRIESKGSKVGKVLLQIRGRMADSGWMSDSPHFTELKKIYDSFGLPLTETPQE